MDQLPPANANASTHGDAGGSKHGSRRRITNHVTKLNLTKSTGVTRRPINTFSAHILGVTLIRITFDVEKEWESVTTGGLFTQETLFSAIRKRNFFINHYSLILSRANTCS